MHNAKPKSFKLFIFSFIMAGAQFFVFSVTDKPLSLEYVCTLLKQGVATCVGTTYTGTPRLIDKALIMHFYLVVYIKCFY